MFHRAPPTTENELGEYAELERNDLLLAIEAAESAGFRETEAALNELLSVLDDLLGVGGSIEYRIAAGSESI